MDMYVYTKDIGGVSLFKVARLSAAKLPTAQAFTAQASISNSF
jgi:hypothetical protein